MPTTKSPDVKTMLRSIQDAIHGSDGVQLIEASEFCQIWGISRSSFYNKRAIGKVGPQPIEKDGHPKLDRREVMAWFRNKDSNGNLHGERTWPSVWERIKKANLQA